MVPRSDNIDLFGICSETVSYRLWGMGSAADCGHGTRCEGLLGVPLSNSSTKTASAQAC